MEQVLKIPLVLTPQPEGGYTVTSPLLPELVTEGDTVEDALENVSDAMLAVIEIYEERERPLPANLRQHPRTEAIWFEYLWSGSCPTGTLSGSCARSDARKGQRAAAAPTGNGRIRQRAVSL